MSGLRFIQACLLGMLAFTPKSATAIDESSASLVTLSVAENAEQGRLVGDVETERHGQFRRFSIIAGNLEAAFSIDTHSGRLTVNNPAALNHENRRRFDLILRVAQPVVDDPARRAFLSDVIESGVSLDAVEELFTEVAEIHVAVHVTDVAERPVLPTQSATVMVFGGELREDARLEVRDEDRDDAFHFEILAGAPAGLFEIDPETGRIRVDPGFDLPAGDHTYPLTVKVSDSGGHSDATTIPVRVIALAGDPSSLVAAPPPVTADPPSAAETDGPDATVAAVESPTETEPVPTASGAAQTDHSTATSQSPGWGAEGVASRAQPASTLPSVTDAHAAGSFGSNFLRTGGIFLLLGTVVGAVLWWLRWRSQRDAADLVEDSELMLRLHSIAAEPIADYREPETPETLAGESALEAAVISQLSELQEALTASTVAVTPGTDTPNTVLEPFKVADGEAVVDDEQSTINENLENIQNNDGTDPEAATADHDSAHEPVEIYEVGEDQLYDLTSDAYTGSVGDDADRDLQELETSSEDVDSSLQSTENESAWPGPDTRDDEVNALSPKPGEPDESDAGSPATVDDQATGSADAPETADDTTEEVDPRVSHLRNELAEKFGIALAELRQDTDSQSRDTTLNPDAAAAEQEPETSDAEPALDDPPSEAATDTPQNGLAAENQNLSEEIRSESPDIFLSTAQYLKQTPHDEGSVETAMAAQHPGLDPTSLERHSSVARPSKTAIRRELSSLRELANLHARAAVAKHATRKRTRQTWSNSAAVMIVLSFVAMGLLGSGTGGLLRLLGWGLMIASAGALAVCLHSFRQMVDSNDTEGTSGTEADTSAAENPNTPVGRFYTEAGGELLPVNETQQHSSEAPPATDQLAESNESPDVFTGAFRS